MTPQEIKSLYELATGNLRSAAEDLYEVGEHKMSEELMKKVWELEEKIDAM